MARGRAQVRYPCDRPRRAEVSEGRGSFDDFGQVSTEITVAGFAPVISPSSRLTESPTHDVTAAFRPVRQPDERRNMPGGDTRATVWHGVGDNEGAISPYGPGTAYVEKASAPNVICVAGRNNLPVPRDPSGYRS